jgi:hypothetical protein
LAQETITDDLADMEDPPEPEQGVPVMANHVVLAKDVNLAGIRASLPFVEAFQAKGLRANCELAVVNIYVN